MNEYGIIKYDPYANPYGIRPSDPILAAPRPAPVPVPAAPIPLPSMYAAMGGMPRMARQMQPVLDVLGRMGRSAAAILPFRPVQHVAEVLTEAGQDNKANQQPVVTPQNLTNWIRKNESNGNYQALNKEAKGNTASGAYQYTDHTWNGYGGYAKALYAPKEVQDRRFQEDIQQRLAKYNGDPFKAIAAHYLPAYAGNPGVWNQNIRLGKTTVTPIAAYVRRTIRGTPLEAQFDEYLANHQNG